MKGKLLILICILFQNSLSNLIKPKLKYINLNYKNKNEIQNQLQINNKIEKEIKKENNLKIIQKEKKLINNIPNIISIIRILGIPLFILLRVFDKRVISEHLFAISSFTDYLDGYIARKYNMTSDFGAFIDPVADKLSVTTALILLLVNIPTWWYSIPVTLIIGRELFVSGLREWMATKGLRSTVRVGSIGKLKTLFQMISIILLLHSSYNLPALALSNPFDLTLHNQKLYFVGFILFYISTFLSLLSAGQYFNAALPVLTSS